MQIKKAEFVTSVGVSNAIKIADFTLPEIAFVGRSNVGKSSLINYLCNRNKLAKTSATPGRTRLINYFLINEEFYFVDLPGYGFAQASKQEQSEWQSLIGGYLESSRSLKHIFVLVDIRHRPNDKDKQMLNYLYTYQIPFSVIATKLDKIKKSEVQKQLNLIASELCLGKDNIMYLSSDKKVGGDRVFNKIDEILA